MLRQVIAGTRPYGPIYGFDCDGQVTDEVEKEQLIYNVNYGVFPCAEQGRGGDGGAATAPAADAPTVTDEEVLALARWFAKGLSEAELRDSVATFRAGAGEYAGTPVGYEFALLADALGD